MPPPIRSSSSTPPPTSSGSRASSTTSTRRRASARWRWSRSASPPRTSSRSGCGRPSPARARVGAGCAPSPTRAPTRSSSSARPTTCAGPAPPGQPEPASAGAAAAIPLAAPVRITADPATNTLIVSATPEDWETLRAVIEKLDVRRRQVFVEAIILEATIDKLRSLGVEFQAGTAFDGHRALAQANLSLPAGGALADPTSIPGLILAAASNKMVKLPDGREVPAHTVLLTALETDSDLNVLSAPNMVTTDNEEAEIVVGRNVPFVASRATSATNLQNLFTTIERHDVGI